MIAEQLKRSILQAAIQGKLTEQLPEDGDAQDLLNGHPKRKGSPDQRRKNPTREQPPAEISRR